MVSVVIHTNMGLKNQTACAGWLHDGFKRHGINAVVTGSRTQQADVHVIQGPHYAYQEWVGKPNVLWLNRCFYGHHFYDLSLGWLLPDGSRDFCVWNADAPNGDLPELQPMKERTGKRACAVVFGDYGKDPAGMIREARNKYGRVYYHAHPADRHRQSPALSPDWTLEQIWDVADVAVGGQSTVLVEAAINGLQVETSDPRHVCADIPDREQWLMDLSWAQWHYTQLASGDFWDHLCTQ
jgi:hypothetical protein